MKINEKKYKELQSIKDTQKAMDFILTNDPLNVLTTDKEKTMKNKINTGDVACLLGSFNEFDEIDYRIEECATKGCVAVVYFYEDKLTKEQQITSYGE
jgi:hypothetical protein